MGKPVKIIYTPDEIRAMSTAALQKLLQKADELGVQRTFDAVTAELAERPLREGGKVARKHASIIKQAADDIARLQTIIADQFDLSPQSANTARPHKVLSSSGGAKAGGDMLNGSVLSYFYVSYRNGDNSASLSVILKNNDEEPFFEVLFNSCATRYAIGEFEDAAAQYEAIIAGIAPAREE